jgi:hypothetical protein
MAKILVLLFEDDADADAIIEGGEGAFFFTSAERREIVGKTLAAYKYPTKWCDCELTERERDSGKIVRRGAKFGWWVHFGDATRKGCGLAMRRFQAPKDLYQELRGGERTTDFWVSDAKEVTFTVRDLPERTASA